MAGLDTLRTPRLTAERLGPPHVEEIRRLHRDPEVMRTLGGLKTDAETDALLRSDAEHWERHGFGLWILRDAADERFVGRGGLRHVEVGGTAEVEIAYALMAAYWGRGLATELARHLVEIAFGPLALDEVVAFTLPTNQGSRRVMGKAGLRYERDITHAGLPHVLYRLRRPAALTSR